MTTIASQVETSELTPEPESSTTPPGMLLIHPQPFRMGAEDGAEAEQPVHEVMLSPFWMDATPVTNAEFARFVEETGHVTASESAGAGWALDGDAYRLMPGVSWRTFATQDRHDHPVILVSWYDAAAFADWCGKRLPTEAEWEYSARAGRTENAFPWGVEEPGEAHCGFPRASGAMPGTTPVRSFPANELGLFDMVGNVWQWCLDWYSPTYYGEVGSALNPSGLMAGVVRVRRGGAWNVIQSFRLRCANRGALRPDASAPNLGFRCVMSAHVPTAWAGGISKQDFTST